jgi:hypothetical protein
MTKKRVVKGKGKGNHNHNKNKNIINIKINTGGHKRRSKGGGGGGGGGGGVSKTSSSQPQFIPPVIINSSYPSNSDINKSSIAPQPITNNITNDYTGSIAKRKEDDLINNPNEQTFNMSNVFTNPYEEKGEEEDESVKNPIHESPEEAQKRKNIYYLTKGDLVAQAIALGMDAKTATALSREKLKEYIENYETPTKPHGTPSKDPNRKMFGNFLKVNLTP